MKLFIYRFIGKRPPSPKCCLVYIGSLLFKYNVHFVKKLLITDSQKSHLISFNTWTNRVQNVRIHLWLDHVSSTMIFTFNLSQLGDYIPFKHVSFREYMFHNVYHFRFVTLYNGNENGMTFLVTVFPPIRIMFILKTLNSLFLILQNSVSKRDCNFYTNSKVYIQGVININNSNSSPPATPCGWHIRSSVIT